MLINFRINQLRWIWIISAYIITILFILLKFNSFILLFLFFFLMFIIYKNITSVLKYLYLWIAIIAIQLLNWLVYYSLSLPKILIVIFVFCNFNFKTVIWNKPIKFIPVYIFHITLFNSIYYFSQSFFLIIFFPYSWVLKFHILLMETDAFQKILYFNIDKLKFF